MAEEIPTDRIEAHPLNSNVMSEEQMRKLRRHIRRTGRYEPLVVRPLGDPAGGERGEGPGGADGHGPGGGRRYQVLNGHHRLEVLRRLGHRTVRCEVWEVDDGEAMLLLATLNRLEGRDDPMRRAALLGRLAGAGGGGKGLAALVRGLPEDRAALERALALAREPLPLPARADEAADALRPMTFFLRGDEAETVRRALALARGDCGGAAAAARPKKSGRSGAKRARVAAATSGVGGGGELCDPVRGRVRAQGLVRLAESFLAVRAVGAEK